MAKRFLPLVIAVIFTVLSCSVAFAKGREIIKVNSDILVASGMEVDNVVAIGGKVTVSGKVNNSVVAVGGSVVLDPDSYVGSDVVIVGGELIKDNSATVNGKITQIYVPRFIPSCTTLLKGGWMALWATISILVLLGFLGLAVLLAALIPEHMGAIVNALDKSFLMMFFWGVLWIILIVPIALFLAISIIGVALIPLEIVLAVLALVLGYIASAIFIGKYILMSLNKISAPFFDAVVGIIVLFLISFIPIVGPVMKGIFLLAGFGAVLTTRFGTVK